MKAKFSPEAIADVREIYRYLDTESPSARRGFEDRLARVIKDARDFPYGGRSTDSPGIRVRNTIPYAYLVYYEVRPSGVIVLRVMHGARNPKSMPARG